MGYYFEHVTASGDAVAYYPESPEFASLDRDPHSYVDSSAEAVAAPPEDVEESFVGSSDTDFYSEAPLTLEDLLPYLVQNQDSSLGELVGIETFALSPIESSTGLKGILLNILGPYDNIVTQYKYQQGNNSYYTYVNEVTPDYPWIASAALFIVLLVSVFGLLKRSMSWMR